MRAKGRGRGGRTISVGGTTGISPPDLSFCKLLQFIFSRACTKRFHFQVYPKKFPTTLQHDIVVSQPPPPDGKVTARFNLKPLVHRWSCDLFALPMQTCVRRRLTPQEIDPNFEEPLQPRIRSRRSTSAPVDAIVITDTENVRERGARDRLVSNNTQGKGNRKLQRSLNTMKARNVTLKKADTKLQRDVRNPKTRFCQRCRTKPR